MLALPTASRTRPRVMPTARSLADDTSIWYWRTNPPIEATSATPGMDWSG